MSNIIMKDHATRMNRWQRRLLLDATFFVWSANSTTDLRKRRLTKHEINSNLTEREKNRGKRNQSMQQQQQHISASYPKTEMMTDSNVADKRIIGVGDPKAARLIVEVLEAHARPVAGLWSRRALGEEKRAALVVGRAFANRYRSDG
jgi:hypothetical protein